MIDERFCLKPKYSESWAIIIGINHYATVSPLTFAVNDAKEFAITLIDKYNFPEKNIVTLIDQDATYKNICDSFFKIANLANVDDRVIFYFAGHGHTISGIRGEVGFLIPHDATDNIASYIPWTHFTNNSDLIHAKHILFIIDACYGGLALTRNMGSGSSRFVKDMLQRLSRQVIASGKANEVVADGGGPLAGHSIFTGHLLEGLSGKAETGQGIITGNSLMAYVYSQVSQDANSHQTPQYGHLSGDGDFIFNPPFFDNTNSENILEGNFIYSIQAVEDFEESSTEDKLQTCKSLISDSSKFIQLHDFMTKELRVLISNFERSNLDMSIQPTVDEILKRLPIYENLVLDLSLCASCLSYWGDSKQLLLLQKIISRLSDILYVNSGYRLWTHLNIFPLILFSYYCGISSVYGVRYDSIFNIFNSTYHNNRNDRRDMMIRNIAYGISEINTDDVFKKIPNYENLYVPMSEYLYALLQPKIDNLFFLGTSYESVFDEFEILLSLSIYDYFNHKGEYAFAPIGRFGWKEKRYDNAPLSAMIQKAETEQSDWKPLRSGLFGGDINRFLVAAKYVQTRIMESSYFF